MEGYGKQSTFQRMSKVPNTISTLYHWIMSRMHLLQRGTAQLQETESLRTTLSNRCARISILFFTVETEKFSKGYFFKIAS